MPPRKRTAALPPAPSEAEAPFTPVRISSKKKAADPGVPLFYLDDVEYRIPTRTPQPVVLEFLRLQRTHGDDYAAQRLLERLLGPDAYSALEQSDDVEDEQFDQILRAAVAHVAGPVEQGKATG
jgi:hypothetical protein